MAAPNIFEQEYQRLMRLHEQSWNMHLERMERLKQEVKENPSLTLTSSWYPKPSPKSILEEVATRLTRQIKHEYVLSPHREPDQWRLDQLIRLMCSDTNLTRETLPQEASDLAKKLGMDEMAQVLLVLRQHRKEFVSKHALKC
jgi:hypothetical protein